MHMHKRAHMHTFTYSYSHTHTHSHTHIHTHTHTHTYTHVYVPPTNTGPPEIVIPLNDSLIEEIVVGNGGDAELQCNFIAFPSASTRWFRVNGQMETQLNLANPESRFQFGDNGTFVIHNVEVMDVGMYRCEVFNMEGTDSRLHRLRVIGV